MALLEQLETALTTYLAWKDDAKGSTFQHLVARHPDLSELLTALHAEETDGPDDIASIAPHPTPDAAHAATSDESILGSFRLGDEIGRGGMGVVYEAEHLTTGDRVALKVLRDHLTRDSRAVVRFLKEARLAASLRHPNLVHVHHVGRDGDTYFFAMERVAGKPLDAILTALDGKSPQYLTAADVGKVLGAAPQAWEGTYIQWAVDVAIRVGEALAHAHQQGVVHRDVKPSNILLDPRGHVWLTDFGLAYNDDHISQTQTGEFAGSPHYVSPEQAMAKRVPLDHRTDVFSLGATLVEILSLEKAFPGSTAPEVLTRILSKDPVAPQRYNPNVSADLSDVCFQALAKDADQRYPSTEALLADLRACQSSRAVQAPRQRWWHTLGRWAAHNRLTALLLSALILGGIISCGLLAHNALELERRNKELTRLSDRDRLHVLRSQKHVMPSDSIAAEPRLAAWLEEADLLAARFPPHQRRLAILRQTAEPYSPEDRERDARAVSWYAELANIRANRRVWLTKIDSDPKMEGRIRRTEASIARLEARTIPRRTYRFDDPKLAWEHKQLSEYVVEMEEFLTPERGMLSVVRRWHNHALTVAQRSLQDHEQAWEEAIRAIQVAPVYGGLKLAPQLGLIPLGPDPESGLWEFGHLQTGSLAQLGESGRLEMNEESGLVFVLLPGGPTRIGADRPHRGSKHGDPFVDQFCRRIESPARDLSLDPFFLSKFEMT